MIQRIGFLFGFVLIFLTTSGASFGASEDRLNAYAEAGDTPKLLELLGDAPQADLITKLLFKAARHGNDKTVEALIDLGADVNAVISGLSTLSTAALGGWMSTIKLLMDRGARRDVLPNDYTPLHYVARGSCPRHCATARMLVEQGWGINARSRDLGLTPLHEAVSANDDGEMIRTLVDLGANPDVTDFRSHTPYLLALTMSPRRTVALKTLIALGSFEYRTNVPRFPDYPHISQIHLEEALRQQEVGHRALAARSFTWAGMASVDEPTRIECYFCAASNYRLCDLRLETETRLGQISKILLADPGNKELFESVFNGLPVLNGLTPEVKLDLIEFGERELRVRLESAAVVAERNMSSPPSPAERHILGDLLLAQKHLTAAAAAARESTLALPKAP